MRSFLNRKKDLCYLLALASCYLVVLFLTSCYTSPLYPDYYGYDSAIFSLIGKGITEGKNLYTELFDHKGPMIFFINALGFSLGGHTGIFLLQCLFGLISLSFLYYTGKMLRQTEGYASLWECLLIFIAGYAVFFYTFQRGNLTEEYSLPFLSCSLFLLVKYALHAEKNPLHPPVYSVFYGVCLAYLAFLRLNNSVTICAGILAVAIYLIYNKAYQNLLWNLLLGIIGILLVAIPVLAYFHHNNSVEEMIYATFLHNFQIARNTAHVSICKNPVMFIILYLPIVVSATLLLCKIKKDHKISFIDFLLGTLLISNTAVLWIANRFPHYFAIFVPVYICVLCRYFYISKRQFATLAVAVCTVLNLALVAGYSGVSIYDIYFEKGAAFRHSMIQSDFDRIPQEERSSVIGYNIKAADYLSGGITPCYKYYTLQDTWSITNPQILDDFIDWVSECDPLWVLTTPEENNSAFLHILKRKYEYQFENEHIVFYRLKEVTQPE